MIIDLNNFDFHSIKNPRIRAILVCLFTDAYVQPDELPAYVKTNKGWWGNDFEVMIGDIKEKVNWGSSLWLLDRAKMTATELKNVSQELGKSLEPLVKAGFLTNPIVRVETEGNRLNFFIAVDGEELEIRGF